MKAQIFRAVFVMTLKNLLQHVQYQCHRPRMENSSIQTVELSRKEMLELEETYPCQKYHHLTTLYNWSAVKLILLGWEGGNSF